MKKLTLVSGLIVLFAGILIYGCKKESLEPGTQPGSSNEVSSMTVHDFNYLKDDVLSVYESNFRTSHGKRRKGRRRWKFSFTFGGGFEACAGGAYCGSCPGLCLSSGISSDTNLTQDEINDGFGLAEIAFVDSTSNNPQEIFFFPQRSMDNGDGYVRIESDFNLGSDFADETGKDITIKEGKYEIEYTSDFPNCVSVFLVECISC